MTMITPSYLGETIEYSSLHACRSTLEDPTTGTLLRVCAPLLAGVVLGVIVQATDPQARLYTAAAPGLVAAIAGLLGHGRIGGRRPGPAALRCGRYGSCGRGPGSGRPAGG